MADFRHVDLASITPAEMVLFGAEAARAVKGAESLDKAAQALVTDLYERLWDHKTDAHATVLVRFYRTMSFGDLQPAQKAFAAEAFPDAPRRPNVKCLTLMGTIGERSEWNSPATSMRHRAIPLPSRAAVERLPMVAQLIDQLGLPIDALVASRRDAPTPTLESTTNVFHVLEALGSPHVPDQDTFVRPYGICSVVGFGGTLTSADLWAVIIFARVPISVTAARLFRFLATDVKIAMAPVLMRSFFGIQAPPGA